jgi:hypothetical protein
MLWLQSRGQSTNCAAQRVLVALGGGFFNQHAMPKAEQGQHQPIGLACSISLRLQRRNRLVDQMPFVRADTACGTRPCPPEFAPDWHPAR